MTFKLPARTYPEKIDTIGKEMAVGHEVSMHCNECKRHVRLNLVQIAKRHGMDYPSYADDLKRIVSCAACKAAGRPRKNVGFIFHQLTAPNSEWPRTPRHVGPFIHQREEGEEW